MLLFDADQEMPSYKKRGKDEPIHTSPELKRKPSAVLNIHINFQREIKWSLNSRANSIWNISIRKDQSW